MVVPAAVRMLGICALGRPAMPLSGRCAAPIRRPRSPRSPAARRASPARRDRSGPAGSTAAPGRSRRARARRRRPRPPIGCRSVPRSSSRAAPAGAVSAPAEGARAAAGAGGSAPAAPPRARRLGRPAAERKSCSGLPAALWRPAALVVVPAPRRQRAIRRLLARAGPTAARAHAAGRAFRSPSPRRDGGDRNGEQHEDQESDQRSTSAPRSGRCGRAGCLCQ